MDLGVMQQGASGALSSVMQKIEEAAVKLAVASLQANEMEMRALKKANKEQANAIKSSVEKQADATYWDGMTSAVSAGVGLAPQVASYGMDLTERGAINAAQTKETAASEYESLIQEGLQAPEGPAGIAGAAGGAPPEEMVGVPETDEEKALLLDRFGAKDFYNAGELDQNVPGLLDPAGNPVTYRTKYSNTIRQSRGNPVHREKIVRSLKAARKAKQNAAQEKNSAIQSQETRRQKFNIFSQIGQSSMQAVGAFQKANIERQRAQIEQTRALMDYVTTVFNQLLQIALAMYNQQVSRASEFIETEKTMVSLNRAV